MVTQIDVFHPYVGEMENQQVHQHTYNIMSDNAMCYDMEQGRGKRPMEGMSEHALVRRASLRR